VAFRQQTSLLEGEAASHGAPVSFAARRRARSEAEKRMFGLLALEVKGGGLARGQVPSCASDVRLLEAALYWHLLTTGVDAHRQVQSVKEG